MSINLSFHNDSYLHHEYHLLLSYFPLSTVVMITENKYFIPTANQ